MITLYIYLIVILTTLLHSLLGCITIPLQGAMMIDATGHSIVFGIISAFIISKSLNSPLIFIGGILSSLLMNFIINLIYKKNSINNKISYDGAIGISFSLLFSIGILLISIYARNIHLDIDMILLGNIEYAIYDTFKIFHSHVPKILIMLTFSLLTLLLIIKTFWTSLIVILFDKEYAKTRNINFTLINLILIIFNSIVIVSTFNAIGALILTGISTAPFAYSWKNSKSYKSFIINGTLCNILFSILGCFISIKLNLPIGATVSLITCTFSLYKLLNTNS